MGKRIGLSGYQNTLGVRAKGDLTHFYGVDRKSVTWITPGKEVVDVELPGRSELNPATAWPRSSRNLSMGKFKAMFVSRLPKPFRDGRRQGSLVR